MEWPPQSPDLNPIERLWDHLDTLLRRNSQLNKKATWEFLQKSCEMKFPKKQSTYTLIQ